MPVCPVCRGEYEDGVNVCPDCNEELIEEVDGKTVACHRCRNTVDEKDQYCRYCGILFVEGIPCTHHPEEEARGVCVICKKPFCPQCIDTVSEVSFCFEDNQYTFVGHWVVVHESGMEWEAQMVKDYLESNGISCMIEPAMAGSHWIVPGGDPLDIRLFVPFEFVMKAETTLEKMDRDE